MGGSSPQSLTPSLSPAHRLPSALAEGQALPQPPPSGFPEDDVHEVFVKRKKHQSFHPPWGPRAWTTGARLGSTSRLLLILEESSSSFP